MNQTCLDCASPTPGGSVGSKRLDSSSFRQLGLSRLGLGSGLLVRHVVVSAPDALDLADDSATSEQAAEGAPEIPSSS